MGWFWIVWNIKLNGQEKWEEGFSLSSWLNDFEKDAGKELPEITALNLIFLLKCMKVE